MQLIAEGYTDQMIAEQLVITINTMQTHRTHIMDNLGIHSRTELMKYAVRIGLMRHPGNGVETTSPNADSIKEKSEH